MKVYFTWLRWLAIVLLGLTLSGCLSNTKPVQFYMLGPMALTPPSQGQVMDKPSIRIELDPVEIPEYIDRPQIVTHLDRAEYQLDEFNRWLEPLSNNLTRVIAENLSEVLQPEGIDIISMSRPVEAEYSLSVQVLRMDGKLGQRMVLVARWSLFKENDQALVRTKRSVFQETIGNDTYQGLVQAQNLMIESLCRAIADDIRPIVTQGAGS